MIYTIKNDKLTVLVNSKGAELISAKSCGGKEYIWQADKRYWGRHAPILFPVCGRLLGSEYTLEGERYEMGSHGFARDMEFELLESSNNQITLVLRQTEQTATVYPFDFTLAVRYSLEGSAVIMNIDVKNNSDKTMPYMLGWHPGFNIEGLVDNYTVSFSDAEKAKRHYMKPSLFIDPNAVDYPISEEGFRLSEKEIYGEDTIILKDAGCESELHLSGKVKLCMKQSENLPFFAIWKAPYSEPSISALSPGRIFPLTELHPSALTRERCQDLRAENPKAISSLQSLLIN